MTANFRAVAGTSGFIPPGAIFKFINTNGLVNFNGEFRTVAIVGHAADELNVLAEAVSRSQSSSKDTLSQPTAKTIDLVGNFAGLRGYLEHRPGVRVIAGDEVSDFSDKIEAEYVQNGAATEDYVITVERIGGAGDISDPSTGAYSVTVVSTGETSIWYAVNDQYGNTSAIPGVNLKVNTTIGEQLGNTALVKVLADPTEGDYLFLADGSGDLDWSPSNGSDVYGQKVGIPVQISVDAFDIIELRAYDTATDGDFSTQADVLVDPSFVTDGLDNATYRFYAINGTQYSVDKTKNGLTTQAIGGFEQNGSSAAVTTVFDSNTPYIIDGMIVNLDVMSATNAFRINNQGSIVRPLSQRKINQKGLQDTLSIYSLPGNITVSDTYKLRVFKSDNVSTGVSSGSFTITSETTEIISAPINVRTSQNLTAIHGCALLLNSTRIKTEDLTGWNLILNASLEGGSLTAPHNWTLGNVATAELLSSTDQIHGSRVLKLPAGMAVGDGATVNTFKFENSTSTRPAKISWYAKSTDGTSAGAGTGINARINFIGASGVNVGVVNTSASHEFTGVTSRFVSSSFNVPPGAIYATVTLYNTAASDAYVDAIQMEQTDGFGNVLDFHESDVVSVRTTTHRTPTEPRAPIATRLVLPEDKQDLLKLVKLEAIIGTRRITADWVVKKLSSSQYSLTQTSTGVVVSPLNVDTRYTNVINGAAITVLSQTEDAAVNWNDFAVNTISVISTVNGINLTNTIPSATYYVSYTYARPADEYYTVKQFLQIPDMLADLGNATPEYSASLGAAIAFENGASIVQTVLLDDTEDYSAALDALSQVEANVVVPMLTVDRVEGGDGTGTPTNDQYNRVTQINFDFLNHAILVSRPLEKKERIIISSQLRGRDVVQFGAEAQAMGNERAILVGPTSVVKGLAGSNGFEEPTVLDGCFLAAAVAGLSSRFDVAEPWLRKPILGFRGLGKALTNQESNYLGASGVLVVGTRRSANPLNSAVSASNVAGQNGALIVSIASTTCTTGTVDQVEPSVVQTKDYVGRTVRDILDEIYIGAKNIIENRSNIEGTTRNILTNMVNSQIITDFRGLTVTTDPLEPRAVNVAFEILPVFPINYILVTFSLIPTSSPNSNLIR